MTYSNDPSSDLADLLLQREKARQVVRDFTKRIDLLRKHNDYMISRGAVEARRAEREREKLERAKELAKRNDLVARLSAAGKISPPGTQYTTEELLEIERKWFSRHTPKGI